jgi:hypothetical protein
MADATPQDAEVQEVQEEQEHIDRTVQRPRDAMMEEIVATRETEVLEDIEGKEAVEEILESSYEEGVEEEIQQEDPKSPVWLKDGNWVTSVKVNGEEVEVPFDGLKTSHQKDAASQQRFEKAAQREKFLAQKEQELRSYAQQLQAHVQKATPPEEEGEEPEKDTDYKELVSQYHQALYEDDADKAAELLQTLTTGRTQATPNVEEAVNKALNQAYARQQVEQAKQQQREYEGSVKQAVAWFESEYPDIAGVPELRAIADNRTVTIMKESPSMAPAHIIHAAAEYAREWATLNISNGKSNSRTERKKKIVSEPKPARKTAKIGEDEELAKTPSQVIEEMRQSRGQPAI